MSQPFRIGMAGLGTVGAGVVRLLCDNHDLIAARAGRSIELAAVSARDRRRDRGVDLSKMKWLENPADLVRQDNLDAIVEVIGGAEGPAAALVETALDRGLSVVTANKALLAHRGHNLAARAEKSGAALMFEAAVAGGIPIIKAVREGYSANNIKAVYGIFNGTCNYILTTMRETGHDFATVLAEAQAKGYAEADPAFDIDGIDAGHKLCVLSALAYGVQPDFKALSISGIRNITAQDIVFAQELGYRIKLLGISSCNNGEINQSVEPCLVPAASPLGAVEGVYNAVYIEGDFAGSGLSVGRGAGAGPTASAVVADLIDLARGHRSPPFGIPARLMTVPRKADPAAQTGRYYLRLVVLDRPGVMADIAAVMRDHNVSMEAVIQRGRDPDKPVSVVITSHLTRRGDIEKAVTRLSALPFMTAVPGLLRIESFN